MESATASVPESAEKEPDQMQVKKKALPKRASLTTRAGLVTYQTRPLLLERAVSYARCLQANRNVQGVEVVSCLKRMERSAPVAKAPHLFRVLWLPAGAEAQQRMFSTVQREQVERAIAEYGRYKWAYTDDGGANVITLEDKKGVRDQYHVTPRSCTCPHFAYRLGFGTGLKCKHMVALMIALLVEGK